MFGDRLTLLKKEHKLENVMNLWGHIINDSNYIGHGDDATSFIYHKTQTDSEVAKLCVKTVKYFKNFEEHSAQKFIDLSKRIGGSILLPINDLLYEDQYVFLYTQPWCERFKSINMNEQQLKDICDIEYNLLLHNVYANISGHNLGIYHDHVIIFDYHDISPLVVDCKHITKILKHFSKYVNKCQLKLKYNSLLKRLYQSRNQKNVADIISIFDNIYLHVHRN